MNDPIHVIVVIDENSDEALYVDGHLRPTDGTTVYACDIADEVRDRVIQFSHIAIDGYDKEGWPEHFEQLMPFVLGSTTDAAGTEPGGE